MAYDGQHVVVHGTETREAAALSLMQLVARAEGRIFDKGKIVGEVVDRKWILNTCAD